MKSILRIFLILFFPCSLQSQSIGIGTQSPASSALVDMSSTNKGMLMPRMTTAQRNAIVSPAAGLVILNLDDYCLDIFDGTYWSKNCGSRITGIDSIPPEWISKAAFGGAARAGAVSFAISDKGYVCSGVSSGNTYHNDLWEYNPASNSWMQKANLPGSARSDAVGFAISGKGYIATGLSSSFQYLNDVWEYNPQVNSWSAKSNFPGAPRMAATAVERPNNQDAIMVGGYPATTDAWRYIASNDNWVQLDFFPNSRYGAVGFLDNGYVVVGTGISNNNYQNDFYYYDSGTDNWYFHSTFGGASRANAVAMRIGTSVYAGTGSNNNGATFLNDFWKYHYTTGWTSVASLPNNPRELAEAFVINGTGYVTTGYGGSYYSDTWAFKPGYPLGYNYESPLPPPDAFSYSDGIWSRDSTGNIFSDTQTKVGIGIESPDATLHVNGSFKATGTVLAPLKFDNTIVNRKLVLYDNANNDHQYYGLGINGNMIRYQVSNTNDAHVFYAGTSTSSSTEIMRIRGNGNVGIGISNATSKLDIQSGPARTGSHATDRPLYITGALLESSSGIEFRHDNGTQGIGFGFNTIYATGSNTAQDLGLASRGTGILRFSTNGTERLRITGTGNVGIGTSAPNAPLQLANNLANRKLVLWEGQNNDHGFYGFGVNGGVLRYQVSSTSDNHIFYAATSGSTSQELMRIKGNGNVTIAGIIEDEAYAAPNFVNGFTNYGNGYVGAGYYKDKQGIVRLRGTVYKNSSPNGQSIFILPAGYRPSSGTIAFTVVNNNTIGVVEILWDGSVFVQNCAAGWISLDTITFRAD